MNWVNTILLSILLVSNQAHASKSQNADKLNELYEFYLGKQVNNVHQIHLDYDQNITYKHQGKSLTGSTSLRKQPGTIAFSIDKRSEKVFINKRHHFMQSYFGKRELFHDGKKTIYDDAAMNQYSRKSDDFYGEISDAMLFNPLVLLWAVTDEQYPHTVKLLEESHESQHWGFEVTFPDKKVYQFWVDSSTNKLISAHHKGKRLTDKVEYQDYMRIKGMLMPRFIVNTYSDNAYPGIRKLVLRDSHLNPDWSQLNALPTHYPAKPEITTYNGKLEVKDLGNGVYWASRNGGNSLYVEFNDHLMVVNTSRRAAERLQAIRDQVSDKPIRLAVADHHHHDHLGGVPFYLSQGANILAAEDYAQPILDKATDTLPESEVSKRIVWVENEVKFNNGKTDIVVYRLKGLLHAETMLLTHFVDKNLIYIADHVYQPIKHYQAIKMLLEELKRLNIKPEAVIPAHGDTLVPFKRLTDLMKEKPNLTQLSRKVSEKILF